MDPTAQGPQDGQLPEGQVAEVAPEAAVGGAPTGFQARINQLTAQRSAAEEEARQNAQLLREALENQRQMMQHFASQQTARQPSAPDPFEQFDPEDAHRLRAVLTPMQRQMQQMQQQFQQQMQAQAAAYQMQQMTAGLPANIASRAQQLFQAWQQSGRNGWTPQDAIVYAQGEAVAQQQVAATQQRTQQQHFNAGYQALPPTFTPPPAAAPSTQPAPQYDPDDPDAVIKALGARLAGKTF